jgi:protein-S-isoprenylcysteine O-methyltransferase Ste14
MQLIGKTTIHPLIFYPGKISGYALWVLLLLSGAGVITLCDTTEAVRIISYIAAGVGLFLVCMSLINLGRSIRLGVPTTKTVLKTSGLYRISRNPMYLGFNLLTVASIVYHWELWYVYPMGIFCLVTYHLIILGEERFLSKRFGSAFVRYKKITRRYL